MTTSTVACPSCGAELRATAKFCDECGSPTKTPYTAAEYKQVTVLFADVVHSMDLAAAVGAERLREIMGALAPSTSKPRTSYTRPSTGTCARGRG
ncbi:zinc-ribbon domain-containing protein [Mycobacterium florentinum]|nr:zinc-ribbon domain-containing protein [Mycobacterium florentinum]